MRDTIDALALLKGAAVGLAAGLIASLAMNQFQAAVASLSSGEDKGEPSTEKAADRISRAVEGEPLADGRKAVAGNLSIMRWVPPWGLPMASQRRSGRGFTAGFGTAFGAGVAAMLEEAVVPAAGLAPPPSDVPAATHVYALVSHLVFGVTAEASRRVLRAAI